MPAEQAVGQGNIVNDVLFVYNNFGQLTTDYQSHEDAVNPATTPKVQYTYADGADNTVRPMALVYPNGRELHYDYGSTGEMADAASRVASLIDDDGTTGPTWVTPAYSKAGNMTTMPQPADPTASYTATYDAWNRLVKLVDGTTTHTIATYQYDGAKRRVVEKTYASGTLDETRHCYFTDPSKWQVIEERLDSSTEAEKQFVWGLRYIDDILLRDRDTNNNGTLDERLYGLQDANWNVTCLVDSSGAAQERFAYSAYGQPLFLNAAFVPQSSSASEWETLYAWYRWNENTELFIARNRTYYSELGLFLVRDPEGYVDGANAYAAYFVHKGMDPAGLACKVTYNCITTNIKHDKAKNTTECSYECSSGKSELMAGGGDGFTCEDFIIATKNDAGAKAGQSHELARDLHCNQGGIRDQYGRVVRRDFCGFWPEQLS